MTSKTELVDDETVVALMLKATGEDYFETDAWKLRMFVDYMNDAAQIRADALPVCGCCGGTGRMPRAPDIGTDQECFVCDGTGKLKD